MKHGLLAIALGVMIAACGQGASSAEPTAQQERMKTCNADASKKNLSGDERKAYMKDCLSGKDMGARSQQDKMKTCNADASAKGLKGDERKAFMKDCLSAKPAMSSQQEKMKTCNAEASTKGLKGDERKAFMSKCLSGS